jgi:hypothetical protein
MPLSVWPKSFPLVIETRELPMAFVTSRSQSPWSAPASRYAIITNTTAIPRALRSGPFQIG